MNKTFSTKKARMCSNVLKGDEYDKALVDVCTDAVDILKEHCGPKSGFATLFDETSDKRRVAKFTTDGINIIRHLDYANPIDNYMLSLIEYVGRGLEDSSGDGTTSSMILCVEMLQNLRPTVRKMGIHYTELCRLYERFSTAMIEILEEKAVIPTSEEEIYAVAYHQAKTSSHGDVKLARLVAELVSKLPKRATEHMVYRMEPVETNKTYRIEIDESDYSMKCSLTDNRMFNNALSNGVNHADCKLVVPQYELVDNNPEVPELLAVIEGQTSGMKPLVILMTEPPSHIWRQIDSAYNKVRNQGAIVTMCIMRQGVWPQCEDSTAIFALKGIDAVHQEHRLLICDQVKFEFTHDTAKIYNLVSYDHTGTNPDLMLKGSALYAFVDRVNAAIKYAEADPNSSKTTINRLKEIRNSVEFASTAQVVIGGMIYEQQSAKDILEDVLKAARESITDGCLQGGFRSMAIAVDSFVNPNDHSVSAERHRMFPKAFLKAILDLNEAIFGNREQVEDMLDCVDVTSNVHTRFSEETVFDKNRSLVLQPLSSYVSLLNRFGDIIPKMICANKAIIPGMVDENKFIDDTV